MNVLHFRRAKYFPVLLTLPLPQPTNSHLQQCSFFTHSGRLIHFLSPQDSAGKQQASGFPCGSLLTPLLLSTGISRVQPPNLSPSQSPKAPGADDEAPCLHSDTSEILQKQLPKPNSSSFLPDLLLLNSPLSQRMATPSWRELIPTL